MSKFPRFKLIISMVLAMILFPAATLANMINMHEQPTDTSKISGTIDLSAGIIPIFTPKNSQWIKVADPRNGNTGWVKGSELKDSQGNIITFSQQVTDTGSGQIVQMTQSSGTSLTPEQKKKLEAQLQDQEKTAKETILKAQKNMSEVLESLKKLYQQQLEIMQQTGFPVLLPSGQTTQQGGPNMQQYPGMRQQQGMNPMMNRAPNSSQSSMQSMPQQPPFQQPGQMPMNGEQMQQPNQQMQQPGNNRPGY